MSIGILALVFGAACGAVAIAMAPSQTDKPRQLCGNYGKALTQATGPKEII